jgi:hypothetical protein
MSTGGHAGVAVILGAFFHAIYSLSVLLFVCKLLSAVEPNLPVNHVRYVAAFA